MATNPPKGDGHRNGAVKQRSQTYNPKTDTWIKRDTTTGRFLDGKKTGHRLKVFVRKNNSAESEAIFRPAIPALR